MAWQDHLLLLTALALGALTGYLFLGDYPAGAAPARAPQSALPVPMPRPPGPSPSPVPARPAAPPPARTVPVPSHGSIEAPRTTNTPLTAQAPARSAAHRRR